MSPPPAQRGAEQSRGHWPGLPGDGASRVPAPPVPPPLAARRSSGRGRHRRWWPAACSGRAMTTGPMVARPMGPSGGRRGRRARPATDVEPVELGPASRSTDRYADVDYDAASRPVRRCEEDLDNPGFPPPVIDPSLTSAPAGSHRTGSRPSTTPAFIPVDATGFLEDDEAVIVVEVDGLAKAYPDPDPHLARDRQRYLRRHPGRRSPTAPCATRPWPSTAASATGSSTSGPRGPSTRSALVMYDRQTESLWAHFTGQGLVGHYAGAQLDFVPAQTVSWAQFAEGPSRRRGPEPALHRGPDDPTARNPYPSYDQEDTGPISRFFEGEVDPTLASKARVVGIADEAGSVAVRFDDLAERPVISVTEAGRNLVVFHRPGLASALDSFQVDGGRDVGQTGGVRSGPRRRHSAQLRGGGPGRRGALRRRPDRLNLERPRPGRRRSRWPASRSARYPTSTPSGSPGPPTAPAPSSSRRADESRSGNGSNGAGDRRSPAPQARSAQLGRPVDAGGRWPAAEAVTDVAVDADAPQLPAADLELHVADRLGVGPATDGVLVVVRAPGRRCPGRR